jgi:hypothetical protein
MANDITDPNINRDEHIEEAVAAKRVVPYNMGTSGLARAPLPLIVAAWDYVGFTSPDVNGNYQTWTFKNGGSGGTTVNTMAVAYDSNSNITSISRS